MEGQILTSLDLELVATVSRLASSTHAAIVQSTHAASGQPAAPLCLVVLGSAMLKRSSAFLEGDLEHILKRCNTSHAFYVDLAAEAEAHSPISTELDSDSDGAEPLGFTNIAGSIFDKEHMRREWTVSSLYPDIPDVVPEFIDTIRDMDSHCILNAVMLEWCPPLPPKWNSKRMLHFANALLNSAHEYFHRWADKQFAVLHDGRSTNSLQPASKSGLCELYHKQLYACGSAAIAKAWQIRGECEGWGLPGYKRPADPILASVKKQLGAIPIHVVDVDADRPTWSTGYESFYKKGWSLCCSLFFCRHML